MSGFTMTHRYIYIWGMAHFLAFTNINDEGTSTTSLLHCVSDTVHRAHRHTLYGAIHQWSRLDTRVHMPPDFSHPNTRKDCFKCMRKMTHPLCNFLPTNHTRQDYENVTNVKIIRHFSNDYLVLTSHTQPSTQPRGEPREQRVIGKRQ